MPARSALTARGLGRKVLRFILVVVSRTSEEGTERGPGRIQSFRWFASIFVEENRPWGDLAAVQ